MLDLWYKNAIVYSLNVATFMDGNDDGVGDFKGLTQRLDHIAKLGVDCIWLLPFYPSPRLDHGYDVTNYYDVAPELGTLGDFVEFSHQARLRGLRLITDLPINHTSDEHPWFRQARADPHSPYRDFYIWSKAKPPNTNDGVVFPGYQTCVWTYDSRARAWYYHRFYPHQPDLNIMCNRVREEIFKIMGFWLELGVSGFRIDAAPFVVQEVRPDHPTKLRYDFFSELRSFLSWRKGDAILLAEANVLPTEMPEYFGDGNRIHMLFAFLVNQYAFLTFARHQAEPLIRGLKLLPKLPQLGQWAHFLRNHDELDLGRLTAQEREECYSAFARDPDMRLYERGIRRRLAPMFSGNRKRIELAFSLMFSLPGAPVIYYGDEIGMGDDLSLPERWPVRTCMQWSDEINGGFSNVSEERLIHPAIMDGEYGALKINAMTQQRDPDSLLSWMRRLVDVRQSCPEIGWGEVDLIDTADPAVIAHRVKWDGSTTVVLHNLGDQACHARVALEDNEAGNLTDLFGNKVYEQDSGETRVFALDGYGYRWFRLDGLRQSRNGAGG
jgi:maltose alpha-D-glucosyltransferase/alpha-amylase